MKSILLLACIFMISACGQSGEETYYTYKYVPNESNVPVPSPSEFETHVSSIPTQDELEIAVPHKPSECPNLEGTFKADNLEYSFSKNASGVLELAVQSGKSPIEGKTYRSEDQTLRVSCNGGSVIYQLRGKVTMTTKFTPMNESSIVVTIDRYPDQPILLTKQ